MGVRTVIIQNAQGDQSDFLHSAWVLQLFRGLLLYLAIVTVCGLVTLGQIHHLIPKDSAFSQRLFPLVTAVLGLTLLLGGAELTCMPLNVRKRPTTNLSSSLIWGAGLHRYRLWSYGLGFLSVWALISGSIAGSLVRVLLHLYVPGPAMAFRWNKDHLRQIVSFGRWVMISSAGTFDKPTKRCDYIGIFSLMPASSLGLYSIAKNAGRSWRRGS